jgi:hypothetical protein
MFAGHSMLCPYEENSLARGCLVAALFCDGEVADYVVEELNTLAE